MPALTAPRAAAAVVRPRSARCRRAVAPGGRPSPGVRRGVEPVVRLTLPPPRPAPTRPSLAPAAVFGVGAPEALVVGVVALLVFGPKGLADAVKAAGRTLRSFQPTLRELASVSSDLRNTLEEQIGLDEIRAEFTGVGLPPPATTATTAAAAPRAAADAAAGAADEGLPSASALADGLDDAAAAVGTEEDIEAMRAASARAAWGEMPPVLSAADAPTQGASLDAALASAAAPTPPLAAATLDELEAELARRRADLKAVSLEELERELARRRGEA